MMSSIVPTVAGVPIKRSPMIAILLPVDLATAGLFYLHTAVLGEEKIAGSERENKGM